MSISSPEKQREYSRRWYYKHRKEAMARTMKARRLNPESARRSERKWKEKNPGYIHPKKLKLITERRLLREKERLRRRSSTEKTCKNCLSVKPLCDFNRSRKSLDGRQPLCRACEAIYQKKLNLVRSTPKWKADHPEMVAKIKARVCAYGKKYRKSRSQKIKLDKQAWTEKNREKSRAIKSRYGKNNPGKVNANTARRRAAIARATPPWFENELVAKIYDEASRLKFNVDHIVPLRSELVCGLHCFDNMQLLAKSENVSKLNRHWPDMP